VAMARPMAPHPGPSPQGPGAHLAELPQPAPAGAGSGWNWKGLLTAQAWADIDRDPPRASAASRWAHRGAELGAAPWSRTVVTSRGDEPW
jgi:hypothetical protein